MPSVNDDCQSVHPKLGLRCWAEIGEHLDNSWTGHWAYKPPRDDFVTWPLDAADRDELTLLALARIGNADDD